MCNKYMYTVQCNRTKGEMTPPKKTISMNLGPTAPVTPRRLHECCRKSKKYLSVRRGPVADSVTAVENCSVAGRRRQRHLPAGGPLGVPGR